MSDLHGHLPGRASVPRGDLLIVAGDICPDFVARAPQRAWFVDTFIPWVKYLDFPGELVTWGNHDHFPRPSAAWLDLMGVDFVKIDELVEIGGLKIWLTPWSNT